MHQYTMNNNSVRDVRAIWISDVHLGTAGCQAESLLSFLKHHESQYLYLVGDIVDGWQLRKSWYWPSAHNDVIQKLLRRARKGCEVVYVPGNHDEAARDYCGLSMGGVSVRKECDHTLKDGRRLLIVHGDEYDNIIRYAKWLAYVGDTLYTFSLWLNRVYNRLRVRLGYPYWSLSAFLKHRVKNAVSFITDFEQQLVAEARRRGYDGVVCGHIHHAKIEEIDGMLYCNDGDWVESLTALVETHEGTLEIVRWHSPHFLASNSTQEALPDTQPIEPISA